MRLRASPVRGAYKEKVRAKKKLIAVKSLDYSSQPYASIIPEK
jgi:hypothetical protein